MGSPARAFTLSSMLALGGLAFAVSPAAAGDSPWFAAAAFGRSSAQGNLSSRDTQQIDDEDAAATLAFGYTLNRHLAVEAGYHDLGTHRGYGSPCPPGSIPCLARLDALGLCVEGADCEAAQFPLEADITGVSLAATPLWPVSDRLSVLGKIGVMSWDGKLRASPGRGQVGGFSGEDLLLGVGLRFELDSGFGVLVQHDEFDLDVRTTTLGVSWRF